MQKGTEFSTMVFFFSFLFRAIPVAYGSSYTRGPIRVAAAGLCHSNATATSETRLQPMPQLAATPDSNPLSKARVEPASSWTLSQVLNPLSHIVNSCASLSNSTGEYNLK